MPAISLTVNGKRGRGRRRPGYAAARRPAQPSRARRHQIRLRPRTMRLLHGADRRQAGEILRQGGVDRRRQAGRSRSRGSARAERPHPLQQAFLDEQAGQCGYCLPGIIDHREGAARRNPAPSRTEIAAGARRQYLPLRQPSPHPARRRTRRRAHARGSGAMSDATTPLPALLQQNPRLDQWVGFPEPGKVADLDRPGRDRPGRADRDAADRGRGTRRRSRRASCCRPATPR